MIMVNSKFLLRWVPFTHMAYYVPRKPRTMGKSHYCMPYSILLLPPPSHWHYIFFVLFLHWHHVAVVALSESFVWTISTSFSIALFSVVEGAIVVVVTWNGSSPCDQLFAAFIKVVVACNQLTTSVSGLAHARELDDVGIGCKRGVLEVRGRGFRGSSGRLGGLGSETLMRRHGMLRHASHIEGRNLLEVNIQYLNILSVSWCCYWLGSCSCPLRCFHYGFGWLDQVLRRILGNSSRIVERLFAWKNPCLLSEVWKCFTLRRVTMIWVFVSSSSRVYPALSAEAPEITIITESGGRLIGVLSVDLFGRLLSGDFAWPIRMATCLCSIGNNRSATNYTP